MLDGLSTEQVFPGSDRLDRATTSEVLALMNSADTGIAAAVQREIPRIARAVDAIVAALQRGGHLAYIGAGTSGRLGVLDASECPPTFQVAAGPGSRNHRGRRKRAGPSLRGERGRSGGRRGGSGRLWFSARRRAGRDQRERPDSLRAGRGRLAAPRLGAVTCGISCTPDSELSKSGGFSHGADAGPGMIAGSTRLRAGTATKMVLNMISTAVMIRLGHVYGNLMVNVQPTNQKLEDRARRIIEQATGVSVTSARRNLLEAGGRSVRTAIVMEKTKVLAARKRNVYLRSAGGRSGRRRSR